MLVDVLGSDHHGYIGRMKSALMMKGYSADTLEPEFVQVVRVFKDGEEVKMSKRTGKAITHRELCEDVGIDAVRYFFAERAASAHLDFDFNLATEHSANNPVYYAQYAYARICSVLKQAEKSFTKQGSYTLLTHPKEVDLMKHINTFTDIVADAAATRSPNKICNYIQKLATYFHSFYGACKINDPKNPGLTNERLALAEATRITLKNALYLLGVSAPEVMAKEETPVE